MLRTCEPPTSRGSLSDHACTGPLSNLKILLHTSRDMADSRQNDIWSPRTIDQILSSGDYSQAAFTPFQQELLRQFIRSGNLASWVLPDAVSRTQRRPRAAASHRTDKVSHGVRKSTTTDTGTTQVSTKRHHGQAKTRVDDSRTLLKRRTNRRHQHKDVPSRQRALAPVHSPDQLVSRPMEITPASPVQSQESGRHEVKTITAEEMRKLYRPVDDPTRLFSQLGDLLEGKHKDTHYCNLDPVGRIIRTYVCAKEDQSVMKALSKITAVVWVRLYPDRRISSQEYQHIYQQTGMEPGRLSDAVARMNHEGRALLTLITWFGLGIVCVTGTIRRWCVKYFRLQYRSWTNHLCRSRDRTLDDNSYAAACDMVPQLKEDCEKFEAPTRKIYDALLKCGSSQVFDVSSKLIMEQYVPGSPL